MVKKPLVEFRVLGRDPIIFRTQDQELLDHAPTLAFRTTWWISGPAGL